MKISVKSGATMAAAAAALVLAGGIGAPAAFADEKGHCVGANACKGKSACKTATNKCAGHNACKGKGFTVTTSEECSMIEGATFEKPDKS